MRCAEAPVPCGAPSVPHCPALTGTRACLPGRDCGWSPLASGLRQCMPQPQYVALHRLTKPLESKSRYDVARLQDE